MSMQRINPRALPKRIRIGTFRLARLAGATMNRVDFPGYYDIDGETLRRDGKLFSRLKPYMQHVKMVCVGPEPEPEVEAPPEDVEVKAEISHEDTGDVTDDMFAKPPEAKVGKPAFTDRGGTEHPATGDFADKTVETPPKVAKPKSSMARKSKPKKSHKKRK